MPETTPNVWGDMNFGNALEELKSGGRVTRSGWNGTGMWIVLSPGHKNLLAAQIWSPQIRAHAEAGSGTMNFRPYLMLLTADGEMVPWVASQSDILADDWSVL